jgi:hypothetical protein
MLINYPGRPPGVNHEAGQGKELTVSLIVVPIVLFIAWANNRQCRPEWDQDGSQEP